MSTDIDWVAPSDLAEPQWPNPKRCKSESPCWGWEGEGEQCQRTKGHDGAHYVRRVGECVLQWVWHPGRDFNDPDNASTMTID